MRKNKKGFTLIECMVAILVVTSISGVALTSYMSARNTSARQWDKYTSSTMADDAIACFQSSDNLNEFEDRMFDGLTPYGDRIAEGTNQNDGNSIGLPYKTIRAYEDGSVKFFNQNLDINNDSYSPVASFNYGGKTAQYDNDVHNAANSLDKMTDLYISAKKTSTSAVTTAMTFRQTKGTETMSMGGSHIEPNTATFDYSETGKIKITDNSNNTGEYALTSLEEYLLSKGRFLGFARNTNTANTNAPTPILSGNKFYFYIYQVNGTSAARIQDKEKYSWGETAKYLVLEVTFDNSPFAEADRDSWNTEKFIHVTSVKQGWIALDETTGNNTIQGKYTAFTDDNGNEFKDFNWYGFPLYAYYCNGDYMNELRTPNWELKGGISNQKTVVKLYYTDYTLKPDATVSELKIGYSLSKNGDTALYTNEGALLFKYTGADGTSTLVNGFGFAKDTSYGIDASGYEKYRIITVGPDSGFGTQDYYYKPAEGKMGCYIRVTYSNILANERKVTTWVLPVEDIDTLISTTATAEQKAEILEKPTYASFRKG